jgi:alpha-ribazole phosphatase
MLARHPRVSVGADICYGRRDVPLRAGWELTAGGLAVLARGAGCRVLYSAPATRCRTVAHRLAATTGMELRIDPRLAEFDFGQWEGRSWQEIGRAALDAWAADPESFAPPGGESGRDLRLRVDAFWHDLRQEGAGACILSHGGPLRLMCALAAGRTPDLLAPSLPQGATRLFDVPHALPHTQDMP